MKRLWFIVVLLGVLAMPVFAAPEAPVEGEAVVAGPERTLADVAADAVAEMEGEEAVSAYQEELKLQSPNRSWAIGLVCLAGAIVVAGGGFAIAMISKACIESTARQPEASGAMFAPMIITAAMIEGAMLLSLILSLLAILRL